jgi:hypothetical protein
MLKGLQGLPSELSPRLCSRLSRLSGLQSDTDQFIAIVAVVERIIERFGWIRTPGRGLLGRHLSFGRGTTGMTPLIWIVRESS